MRAVIEVERDGEGRLAGVLDCSGAGRRRFIGLMELVGLLEDALEADPAPPAMPEGDSGGR